MRRSIGPPRDKQTLAERVKVFVRVRPALKEETPGAIATNGPAKLRLAKCVLITTSSATAIHSNNHSMDKAEAKGELQYDAVLPQSTTQEEVYTIAVEPVVDDVLNGYNGTIMACTQKVFCLHLCTHPDGTQMARPVPARHTRCRPSAPTTSA